MLLAFERVTTRHYCVRRAKTSLFSTRTKEGKAELSLGVGILKLFDAGGKLTGEVRQGIEIEIERMRPRRKNGLRTSSSSSPHE